MHRNSLFKDVFIKGTWNIEPKWILSIFISRLSKDFFLHYLLLYIHLPTKNNRLEVHGGLCCFWNPDCVDFILPFSAPKDWNRDSNFVNHEVTCHKGDIILRSILTQITVKINTSILSLSSHAILVSFDIIIFSFNSFFPREVRELDANSKWLWLLEIDRKRNINNFTYHFVFSFQSVRKTWYSK